ncbi:MAG: radical SAM family heme chaperone HemW [Thermoanaerobaculia bacterium]|nr:radical SAM family heme chaperone HemW [Thermoanaerobaculia bacterium]
MTVPAGLYVHLPYCAVRCAYCTFFVSTDESSRTVYLQALGSEAAMLAPSAGNVSFDSIYLGGGTPSRIPGEDLARLLGTLRNHFSVRGDAEITLEANPEDVRPSAVAAWREAGINRFSLGVQSFADAELAAAGRSHAAAGARGALRLLAGSDSGALSADLILGLPEQTPRSFRESVERLLEFPLDHVSIYLLEDSRETAEDRLLRPGRYMSDDEQADLWLEAGARLERGGLAHYEVSSWARAGRRARHNLKYWDRTPTLGLGVSAHEFWQGSRRANVSSLPRYVGEIEAGRRPVIMDRPIDAQESARETIILGMRKAEGVPAPDVEAYVSARSDHRLARDWVEWREAGLVQECGGRASFTERGFLVSNEILCRFV